MLMEKVVMRSWLGFVNYSEISSQIKEPQKRNLGFKSGIFAFSPHIKNDEEM